MIVKTEKVYEIDTQKMISSYYDSLNAKDFAIEVLEEHKKTCSCQKIYNYFTKCEMEYTLEEIIRRM